MPISHRHSAVVIVIKSKAYLVPVLPLLGFT